MKNSENEDVKPGFPLRKADEFDILGFLMGAVMGVFMIWGIGRFADIRGEELANFYRFSYIVFIGLASLIYYKRLKI